MAAFRVVPPRNCVRGVPTRSWGVHGTASSTHGRAHEVLPTATDASVRTLEVDTARPAGQAESRANGMSVSGAETSADLRNVVDRGQVRTVFQPIVDLWSGTVVGYEALTRGPAGPYEQPAVLFAAARAQGCLGELDALCRRVAVQSAIRLKLFAPLTIFINVEPDELTPSTLDPLIDLAASAGGKLQLVLEVTERALASRPADLLASVRRLRTAGWRIALDDVGADDLSLAFMSLLRPEVIKLDLQLVHRRPDRKIAEIMTAVNSFAERTGSVVVAEGIETDAHLATATALGAQLGQGWLFGRPASDPKTARTGELRLPVPVDTAEQEISPFECLPSSTMLRRSPRHLLIEVSQHLEQEAARLGKTSMLLVTFQQAKYFTPDTAERYRGLAAQAGFVGAITAGATSDPLRKQWAVTVLAPHFAAALLARELPTDPGHVGQRVFEFAVTYDRDVVEAAARTLISRLRTPGTQLSTPSTVCTWTWPPKLDSSTDADISIGAGLQLD